MYPLLLSDLKYYNNCKLYMEKYIDFQNPLTQIYKLIDMNLHHHKENIKLCTIIKLKFKNGMAILDFLKRQHLN